MRFTDVLNQLNESSSTRVIDKKDFPDWLKSILAKNSTNVQTANVEIGTKFTVGTSVYEYERVVLIAYNGETGESKSIKGAYYDGYMNADKAQRAMMHGIEVDLKPNNFIVELHQGNKTRVKVYAHPDSVSKMIEDNSSETLSKEELIVLVATRSLKSSYAGIKNYRYHEARRTTGIPSDKWDEAKAKLIQNGYLNSAGALTTKGKNAVPFDKYRDLYHLKQNLLPPKTDNENENE